ncbi:unnamed protein product [Rotaria sordida]|uniref:Peptidase S1 domain-containing protein n=1 Tax=Rotaria sordida TaxID=392033 RepID=A0A814MML5_9BILA|nr:unnamed protein product [Rotaria sordida]
MFIMKNLVFFLILLVEQSITNDDFDRLPKPPVNYRHFVEQVGQTYKILGSCSEVKFTEHISRCIIQIGHKYMPKYMSINFAQESTGTGVIIFKSIKNDISSIIILTTFHIVVPQMNLSFFTFAIITFLTTLIILIGSLIFYSSIISQQLLKVFCGLIIYMIICTCFMYCIILMIYPFLFESLFRIRVVSGGKTDFNIGSYSMNCQLISSKLILSKDWWDDIAIIKCSNIETNLFSYIEVCQAALNNSQSISSGSSISVIGFVSRPPVSFDLIVDPFFSSLSPLISIPAIHGKTPEHFFLHNKFMNCTGQLRLIDNRKLFIDTPSTYGFSGAPCVSSLNRNQWEFIGILTGASKLWNTCTSLPQSTIFNYYYNKIVLNTVEDNVHKNDL